MTGGHDPKPRRSRPRTLVATVLFLVGSASAAAASWLGPVGMAPAPRPVAEDQYLTDYFRRWFGDGPGATRGSNDSRAELGPDTPSSGGQGNNNGNNNLGNNNGNGNLGNGRGNDGIGDSQGNGSSGSGQGGAGGNGNGNGNGNTGSGNGNGNGNGR